MPDDISLVEAYDASLRAGREKPRRRRVRRLLLKRAQLSANGGRDPVLSIIDVYDSTERINDELTSAAALFEVQDWQMGLDKLQEMQDQICGGIRTWPASRIRRPKLLSDLAPLRNLLYEVFCRLVHEALMLVSSNSSHCLVRKENAGTSYLQLANRVISIFEWVRPPGFIASAYSFGILSIPFSTTAARTAMRLAYGPELLVDDYARHYLNEIRPENRCSSCSQ